MNTSDPSIRPPVFGLTNDDKSVTAFASIEEAEGYAEPWDVNDGLWKFWDSSGRVLAAPGRIDEKASWTRLVATTHLEPDELRSALLRSIEVAGLYVPDFDALLLDDLGRVASDHLQVRYPRWMSWRLATRFRRRRR